MTLTKQDNVYTNWESTQLSIGFDDDADRFWKISKSDSKPYYLDPNKNFVWYSHDHEAV